MEGNRIDDLGPSPLGQSFRHHHDGNEIRRSGGGNPGTGTILIFPRRGVVHFDRAHGFPNNWVRTLCEDREGTLWVGTGTGGLVALRPSRVATLNAPDDWQGANVLSITSPAPEPCGSARRGRACMAFRRPVDALWRTAMVCPIRLSGRFPKTPRKRLWVGTWGGGLFFEHSNRFERCPVWKTLRPRCWPSCMERTGVTWIGTETGLLRYQSGTITRYGTREDGWSCRMSVPGRGPGRDIVVWHDGRRGGPPAKWRREAIPDSRWTLQRFRPVSAPGHPGRLVDRHLRRRPGPVSERPFFDDRRWRRGCRTISFAPSSRTTAAIFGSVRMAESSEFKRRN